MTDATLEQKVDHMIGHSDDPILEKKTHSYGLLSVYPPASPSESWAEGSFLLKSEKGPDDKPLYYVLKASAVWECFNRPHFIGKSHLFDEV